MAHHWYTNYYGGTTNMAQLTEDPFPLSNCGDPSQSGTGMLSQNKVAVNDVATTHEENPIKLTHSNSHPDGSAPQRELTHPGLREATDVWAYLARPPVEYYSKPKDPQTKPMQTMEASAPSSSAPQRAPIAQMVPFNSNAVVTASPATAILETSTTRHIRPDSRSTTMENPQVSFPATDLSSLPTSSILPSTSVLPTQSTSKKGGSTSTPKISLTPAPATAPSAFKDASLAAHIQNTKFLSPVKQRTNGVRKRQQIQSSSPSESVPTPEPVPARKRRKIQSSSSSKSVPTPKSVPAEKRKRGRPRTQVEEQLLPGEGQYRPSTLPSTPMPRKVPPKQSNPSVAAPSNHARQRQQAVTPNIHSDSTPILCSEEPRLWPGRGDHVASLLHFNSKPVTTHSEPIQICDNHAAHHQDSHESHGHGVCTTCRQGARRHIRATRPELLRPAWWPLCKACGDHELLHTDPKREGCSCAKKWLCFPCYTHETERRSMKNSVEAEFRRRTIIGAGMDRGVESVALLGWACSCGREVGPDATLMTCIGCDGMRVGKLDLEEVIAREKALTRNALAWT